MKFIAALLAFYRPHFNRVLVSELQTSKYRIDKYLVTFWRIINFNNLEVRPDINIFVARNRALRIFLDVGGLSQVAFGIILIILGGNGQLTGGVLYGVVAVISYPLVWAHLLTLPALLFRLPAVPKEIGRQIVLAVLAYQVRKLRASHDFKIIAVAGSAGKTSTKFAIAQVLETKLRVRWQAGNYNDPLTVPLIFFGETEPSLYNVAAWVRLFRRNERAMASFDFDVVVVELGTDGPGQLAEFGKYLEADISVLTAITPEHMEFFGSIENVAHEEVQIENYSKELLINSDLCPDQYWKNSKKVTSFAIDQPADFRLTNISFKYKKHSFVVQKNGRKLANTNVKLLSKNQLYSVAAACAMADELGFTKEEITDAVTRLEPVNGRLKPLRGIRKSTILDDSYNSAPDAAIAALETLYSIRAPQKIAVLGNMNELGVYSEEAHRIVGECCDPKKLDFVVTIGSDASQYLAPAAKNRGCNVRNYAEPYAAGAYVKGKIKNRALILVKGSQNGVFAEEAVKILLADKGDESKLVRQSPAWLKLKDKRFGL